MKKTVVRAARPPSTTSRRTRKPSKATFSISTSGGRSRAGAYVESTLAVFGRTASGLRRSKRTAAFSTSAPARSSRTAIRQASSTPSSTVEAVRRRHDVVVHQPDPVEARVVRRLQAGPEARRRRRGSRAAASRPARGWSRGRAPPGCGRCWRCRRRYTASGPRLERGEPGRASARAGRRGCRSRRRPRRTRSARVTRGTSRDR